ncbi:MAG: hypothetical protein E7222_10665 [Clostridiales bacterium]|nr:hypothetical protein [Clostridiales bacterium]
MMWFKLKVDTVADLHFRVRDYGQNKKGDDWCVIDLAVKSDVIDYGLYNDEALEVYDVAKLEDALEKSLSGQNEEGIKIDPIEPYMVFEVFSKKVIHDIDYGAYMTWQVILWGDDGAPSESTINLSLYREDMEKLLAYLKYAKGEYPMDHPKVQKLIEEDNLYGD